MQRRERFRFGVYATLTGLAVFLGTMLFQGCRQEQRADAKAGTISEETIAATPSVVSPDPTPVYTETAVTAATEPVPTPQPAPAPAAADSMVPTQLPTSALSSVPPTAESAPASAVVQSPSTITPTAAPAKYTVKKGDTLTRIARNHKTTVAALKVANSLSTDRIVVGSKLTIPAAAVSQN